MDCSEGFVAADCSSYSSYQCSCSSSSGRCRSCVARRVCVRYDVLTCGGYEAVEVSHRGVVDERVGDHGCGVLLTIRVGVDGGIL